MAKNVTEGFFVRFFVEMGLTRMVLKDSVRDSFACNYCRNRTIRLTVDFPGIRDLQIHHGKGFTGNFLIIHLASHGQF